MPNCHNRPRLLIGLTLLLGLILTACGERQPAAGEATNSIQLVAQDIRFQPEALTIQAKQKVRRTFTKVARKAQGVHPWDIRAFRAFA